MGERGLNLLVGLTEYKRMCRRALLLQDAATSCVKSAISRSAESAVQAKQESRPFTCTLFPGCVTETGFFNCKHPLLQVHTVVS